MAVNWSLGLQQSNPGDAFNQAFQQGQQNNRANTARSAMAALVADPNNPRALSALAQVDPQSAMEFRKQQLEYHKAQLAEHSDSILKGAQILREVNPQDQASYSRALMLAQQAGVDVSQVPQQFDPKYVQGVVSLADALKPQTSDNMKFITPQPGGGAYGYDPRTGAVKTIIQPNDGSQPAGTPAASVPQVHDQSSYDAVPPGAQYMTPDGHIRVKGGQAGQSSPAGF